MVYKIPKASDPGILSVEQAKPRSEDFDILAAGFNSTYVQSGCAVTATGTNRVLTIAPGTVVINGVGYTVSGNTVTITSNAAQTLARFHAVYVDASGIAAFSSAAESASPTLPDLDPTTQVTLATVYMPAPPSSDVVATNQLVDKRVLAQAHGAVAHTGDVLPNNTIQDLGTGAFDLVRTVQSNIGTPVDQTHRRIFHERRSVTSLDASPVTVELPRIAVKDGSGVVIPMEGPLYGTCDYLLIFDGTNYYAKNMRTATVDFVSNSSLHWVHNAAAQAGGVAAGTSADQNCGSKIYLTTPNNAVHEYYTDASLLLEMGETLVGPGRGTKIRPTSAWVTAPTYAYQNAVVSSYSTTGSPVGVSTPTPNRRTGRNTITGITVQGRTTGGVQKANLIGFLHRPDKQFSLGADATKSEIYDNEAWDCAGGGLFLGHSEQGGEATANTWIHHCFLHDMGGGAKNIAIYMGDGQMGEGMQSTATGTTYPLWISGAPYRVVGASHYGLQGGSSTRAGITVSGSSNCYIDGAYIDNVNANGAVGIDLSGSKHQVRHCWLNAGGASTDLVNVGVQVTGDDCTIQDCYGEGNNSNAPGSATNLINWKSIVNLTGSPAGLRVTNNTFRYCKNVYTGTGTPDINTGNIVFYDPANVQANAVRYYSDKRGVSASIATGGTVAHNLDRTPAGVIITPTNTSVTNARVSAVGVNNFTITFGGGVNSTFYWHAWT